MIVWHKHHLVPRHAGGTDDPKNLVKCNLAMHAFLHKLLWEEHGRWQDRIAWKVLQGKIPFAVASQEAHWETVSKEWIVWKTDNEDNRQEIKSLGKFCRENGLRVRGMTLVADGKQDSFKGWRCIRAPGNEKNLVEPQSFESRNKRSVAMKGNKIHLGYKADDESRKRMSDAQSGEKHRNWGKHWPEITRRKIADSNSEEWIVMSPLGKRQKIKNLTAFCRENEIFHSAMIRVSQGKQNNHKGWFCTKLAS